jgi:hypothetical protein
VTPRLTESDLEAAALSAAAVVLGRTANGRTEWKDKDGRTLKEIQSAGTPGEMAPGEEDE